MSPNWLINLSSPILGVPVKTFFISVVLGIVNLLQVCYNYFIIHCFLLCVCHNLGIQILVFYIRSLSRISEQSMLDLWCTESCWSMFFFEYSNYSNTTWVKFLKNTVVSKTGWQYRDLMVRVLGKPQLLLTLIKA